MKPMREDPVLELWMDPGIQRPVKGLTLDAGHLAGDHARLVKSEGFWFESHCRLNYFARKTLLNT